MHLWNDYEGKTVAGQWTVGRLLRTEGRSALFTTTRASEPATLRLTEALNDQAVLRSRYAAIQAAGDQYLVRIQEFGDAELDGTPLSYAVIEPTQESLADIVATRKLSIEETQEVATNVAGGLRALHAQGLVHGMVEPESVLAAGDQIKLRSDCARPAPAPQDLDLEGVITPRSDAIGLAGVIYRALTQRRLRDASDALQLPEPFATIVRNTMRGMWGVSEIGAELMRANRTAQPAMAPAAPATAPVTAPAPRTVAPAATLPLTAPPVSASSPVAPAEPAAALPATPTPTAQSLGRKVADHNTSSDPGSDTDSSWRQPGQISPERRRVIAITAAAIVVVVLLFAFFHHSAPKAAAPAAIVPAPTSSAAPSAPQPAPQPRHLAAAPAVQPAAASPQQAPARLGGPVWRVVAFTYNRRDQALAKANWVNRHYRGFHAAVWSRSGHAPFLVTLDGALGEKQAYGLRDHARAVGIARDVYAQDYSR
jgi:hypothetical protein